MVVHISESELLLGDEDGVIADKDFVRLTEKTIGWVLWAVFAYPNDVGVKPMPFW